MPTSIPPVRGVVFDMDGCLVDSEPLCQRVIAEAMQALGLRDVTAREIGERFLGVAMCEVERFVADQLGRPTPAGFATRIEDQLIALYRSRLGRISGADTMLRRLTEAGFALGLATGSSVRRMHATLEISGLAHHFSGRAVSAETVAAGKPAPDVFLEAAKCMNIAPSACIVVEDSPHGVTGAARAGMSAVGFVGGLHLRGREDEHGALLQTAGAIQVFRDLEALCRFILSERDDRT